MPKVLAQLEKHYKRLSFVNYHKPSSPPHFAVKSLPFWKCIEEPYYVSFGIHDSLLDEQPTLLSIAGLCSQHSFGRTALLWQLDRMSRLNSLDYFFSVSAGKDRHGYFCGVHAGYEYSPGRQDKKERCHFFREVMDIIGMSEQVQVELAGDDLIMQISKPWVLNYLCAEIDGKNPSDFDVCGFPNLEEAITKASQLVSKYDSGETRITFRSDLMPDKYKLLRPHLNDLWKEGWTGTIIGRLDEEARAILGGAESTACESARIPAFIWYTTKDEIEVYGSVLVEGKDRYLEIATEEGDQVNLLDQVAFLEGVKFEFVTDNT